MVVEEPGGNGAIEARFPPIPRFLRWAAANPSRAAVGVFVGLMVYQACLPYGLTLDASARTFDWGVLPSGGLVSRGDIVGNVIPYWVFGHFVLVAAWRGRRTLGHAGLVAVLGTVAMVATVEAIQLFNPIRTSTMSDLLSGAIGAGLALITGAFYCLVLADRVTTWLRREATRRPAGIAAAGLAGLILTDAAKPFHVISSTNLLWDNIKRSNLIPFRPRGADIRDQLQLSLFGHDPIPLAPIERSLDYWASQAEVFILYLCLLGLLAYGRRRAALGPALLTWAAVVVGAEVINLGIVGGAFDVTQIVVALIGAPLALWGARRFEGRPRAGLVALGLLGVAFVIVTDLRPFELGPAQTLSTDWFVPLIHHYRNIDATQLWNLVDAALVFVPVGAAVYAHRLSRYRGQALDRWPHAQTAVWLCGLVALGLEVSQIWLVGRTPGLEDVLLAMLGGYGGASLIRLLAVISETPDRSVA